MALEFICTNAIRRGMKISKPERATHYTLKGGEIHFHRVNPTPPSERFKSIPEEVREVSFPDFHSHKNNVYYGRIGFYDSGGKVINE